MKPVIPLYIGDTGTRGFRSKDSVFPVRVVDAEHGKPDCVPEISPGKACRKAGRYASGQRMSEKAKAFL